MQIRFFLMLSFCLYRVYLKSPFPEHSTGKRPHKKTSVFLSYLVLLPVSSSRAFGQSISLKRGGLNSF